MKGGVNALRMFRRKKSIKLRFFIAVSLLLCIALLLFLFVDNNIKPVVLAMSESTARSVAIKAMNNSVKRILGDNIKYTDLINVLTDKDGKIAMIQANTVHMNTLASEASLAAQNEIVDMSRDTSLYIPLGSIFGTRILAGLGPKIRVKIVPVGSVSTDFATEFENAGINQTRHKIYIIMKSQVQIVVPLGSETIQVSTRIPVSETIIVGEVPNNYVNVDDTDKMLNLIPDPNISE
jgi:sporulation protein YunB